MAKLAGMRPDKDGCSVRACHSAAIAAALLLAGCGASQAAQPGQADQAKPGDNVKVQTLKTFRGIDNCLQLTAGKTRAVVVPAWAGRLSLLDFGNGNELFNHSTVSGKILKPQDAWALWDGNATDVATGVGKQMKNQWKKLWLHPWPTVEVIPGGVRLASEVNQEAGLSAEKTYRLSGDGKSLTYTYTLTCHAGPARPWTIWERCLVPGGGYVLAPLAKGGPYPVGWKTRDNTTVEPAKQVQTQGDFVVIRAGTKQGAGLAARLSAGWIASVHGRGAMVMTYPLDPHGQYPRYDGANAIFWVATEDIEVEPISPQKKLEPGQTMHFTQVWKHLTIPERIDAASPQAVGAYIGAQLALEAAKNAKPAENAGQAQNAEKKD